MVLLLTVACDMHSDSYADAHMWACNSQPHHACFRACKCVALVSVRLYIYALCNVYIVKLHGASSSQNYLITYMKSKLQGCPLQSQTPAML